MYSIMISFDLKRDRETKAYKAFFQNSVDTILEAEGLVDFKTYYSAYEHPDFRTIFMSWKTLHNWVFFSLGEVWANIEEELKTHVSRYELKEIIPINLMETVEQKTFSEEYQQCSTL